VGVVLNVDGHPRSDVVALRFHQHFLAHDDARVELAPVHPGPVGFIQQPTDEQRIGAQQGLLKPGPYIPQDGAGHVLTNADICHGHGAGIEHHAHRKAIDEQRGLFVHREDVLQAEVDGEPRAGMLRAGSEPKSVAAAFSTGTREYICQLRRGHRPRELREREPLEGVALRQDGQPAPCAL
jgi:hypothetical protein